MDLSWQLQAGGGLGFSWFKILKLCFAISDLRFGKHLYDSFTFLLITSGCRGDQPQEFCSNVGFDINGVWGVEVDHFSGSCPPLIGGCCWVKF